MAESDDGEWFPLPREEVIKALEHGRPSRIPLIMTKWWGEGMVERHGEELEVFEKYPDDIRIAFIEPVIPEQMGLSWDVITEGAHDARVVVDEWEKLDEFIQKLPDPEQNPQMDRAARFAEGERAAGRYVLFGWWRLFFERPWGIRGMQNLLMDYYLAPEQIHRLHDALCSLYCAYLDRAARDIQPDGFWTSDDLGHQTQLFMSPKTFREQIKPYYLRLGETLRQHNMHWWLHSCGNNMAIMEDLIEAGVNVFHPVQKGTMDEQAVASEFGDRMTFLAGFDVQHILPEGTPESVRQEVRHLIDTFDQPQGGMCMAAGNGILPGTPLENIDAFLDETLRYGAAHRAQYSS